MDNGVHVVTASPANRSRDRPLVYAHRGGRALGPENTIPAFDLGTAAGADGFEFDVHLSKDDEVVICHDPTLDRTTDVMGPVADRTANALAAVNATLRFGVDLEHEWNGKRAGIPTLREVLLRYPGAPIVVEMKATSRRAAEAVVRTVREADAVERVCVGSFSREALEAVRALEPAIATGASRSETQWALYGSWLHLAPRRPAYRAFQVPETAGRLTVVSPRFLRCAHRADIAVQVWTVNESADMRRLLDWGVDGLISDRPDVAVQVRDSWVESRGSVGSRTNAATAERQRPNAPV